MRVTLKDTEPGRCGSVTRDANIEPIVLHLSAKDRECIAAMAPDATRIVFYPEDLTVEQASAYLEDARPNPPEKAKGENPHIPAEYRERLENMGKDGVSP